MRTIVQNVVECHFEVYIRNQDRSFCPFFDLFPLSFFPFTMIHPLIFRSCTLYLSNAISCFLVFFKNYFIVHKTSQNSTTHAQN